MAKKEFVFHGKKLEELQGMKIEDFVKLVPSRQRRSIKRMLSATKDDERVKLYNKVKKKDAAIRTHCRDFVILPEMVGLTISIHNGKEFKSVMLTEKMIGHFLGEHADTRTFKQHSAPGIGASRSTKFTSVRA